MPHLIANKCLAVKLLSQALKEHRCHVRYCWDIVGAHRFWEPQLAAPSTHCQQLRLQPRTKQRPQPVLLQRRMLAPHLAQCCSSSRGPSAGAVATGLRACPREWFPGPALRRARRSLLLSRRKAVWLSHAAALQLTGWAGVAAPPVLQEILIIQLLPEIQLGKKSVLTSK